MAELKPGEKRANAKIAEVIKTLRKMSEEANVLVSNAGRAIPPEWCLSPDEEAWVRAAQERRKDAIFAKLERVAKMLDTINVEGDG